MPFFFSFVQTCTPCSSVRELLILRGEKFVYIYCGYPCECVRVCRLRSYISVKPKFIKVCLAKKCLIYHEQQLRRY